MSARFTPGPWAISGVADGRGDISLSADRFVVATAHNGVSFFDVLHARSPEQQWANARLISCAPDFYTEALRMVERHDEEARQCNFKRCGCENCTPFRALIARANGEVA